MLHIPFMNFGIDTSAWLFKIMNGGIEIRTVYVGHLQVSTYVCMLLVYYSFLYFIIFYFRERFIVIERSHYEKNPEAFLQSYHFEINKTLKGHFFFF